MKNVMIAVAILFGLLLAATLSPHLKDWIKPGSDVIVRKPNTVYCDPVPDEMQKRSSKSAVDGTVTILKKEILNASVSISDEQINERLSPISISRGDFLVLQRGLCMDYANGALSGPDYVRLKERILPLLEKRISKDSRFDAVFEKASLIPLNGGKRLEVTINLVPQVLDNNEVASITYGMVVAHDEAKLKPTGQPEITTNSCEDRKVTCLGADVRPNPDNPWIVRGGGKAVPVTFRIDIPRNASAESVRLYWDFYQLEADNEAKCVKDNDPTKPQPREGIPLLHVVDKDAHTINGAFCYRAFGTKTILLKSLES